LSQQKKRLSRTQIAYVVQPVNLKALSEAKQSIHCEKVGLLRRYAPRNDGRKYYVQQNGSAAFISGRRQRNCNFLALKKTDSG